MQHAQISRGLTDPTRMLPVMKVLQVIVIRDPIDEIFQCDFLYFPFTYFNSKIDQIGKCKVDKLTSHVVVSATGAGLSSSFEMLSLNVDSDFVKV